MNWWRKEQTNQHCFKQTVADICKFVLDQCVHEGRAFFNKDSPLGEDSKYKKHRKWSTMLRLKDYTFDMDFAMR
jgi:hypothetical protein